MNDWTRPRTPAKDPLEPFSCAVQDKHWRSPYDRRHGDRPPDGFVVNGCVWLIKDHELWEIDPERSRATNHGPLHAVTDNRTHVVVLCDMPIDGG